MQGRGFTEGLLDTTAGMNRQPYAGQRLLWMRNIAASLYRAQVITHQFPT